MSGASPFEIASVMVDEECAIDPITATVVGVKGFDDQWPDLGPDGVERTVEFTQRHLDLMATHLDHHDPSQRLAAEVITDRLLERRNAMEHGDHLFDVAHMACSFDSIRSVFDVMDTTTDDGRSDIVRRLSTIDEVLAGYQRRLLVGIEGKQVAPVRQVESVLEQIAALVGPASAFDQLAERMGDPTDSRRNDVIITAKAAMTDLGSFLRTEYLPHAPEADTTDRDRYLRAADAMVGLRIDPEETYDWGWEEISRIRSEMSVLAGQIEPGGDIDSVADSLATADPGPDGRAVPDAQAFLRFVEERQSDALAKLDGQQFDVPAQARSVAVKLAPPGNPPGAYYIPPSEDFARAGSIWYSIADTTAPVPLYQEVATAYHEGFPGHHLQNSTVLAKADTLSRYQRLFVWYPGFAEGWALYSERLMAELGWFERPEYLFGMLASGLLRAARVVVDIGSHLDLPVPIGAPLGAGERWTFERAVEFIYRIGLQPPDYAESEVLRYLGWPGQAISYKLGEREILALRGLLGASSGPALTAFHSQILSYGDIRLDRLTTLMTAAKT